MKRSYTSLLRIIDLGLLLLMAFFAVTHLNSDVQVALPSDKLSPSADVYRAVFTASMQLYLEQLPEGKRICQASTSDGIGACLRQVRGASLLLAPTETATLQHLVHILDICHVEKVLCAIEP